MLKTMHIGIDDTDSTRNGCTTYIAALLVEKIEKLKARLIDYPNLIRLNPNVPWKTRGNGALCLRFKFKEELEAEIRQHVEKHDLYMRFDKQSAFLGSLKIGRDDPLRFKIHFKNKTPDEIVELCRQAGMLP